MNNYRLTLILLAVSNIFEKMVHNQLYSYLSCKYIVFNGQFGFQCKLSTTYVILNPVQYLYDSIDSVNIVLSPLFLNCRKTFDLIDHKILLSKLDFYGIWGIVLEFFKSYLPDRSQCTVVGGASSKMQSITHGVPQGSVIGPLLFLIYINDLHNSTAFFSSTYCMQTTAP